MSYGYTVVSIGFDFFYFGKTYTQVTISHSGYVCLGENVHCNNTKRPLPYDILVGLNYELNTRRNGSGQIFYENLNDSTIVTLYVNLLNFTFVPKNIFMITYENVLPFDPSFNSRVSFQIYLLTDSVNSYVIFKYTSCPTDLTLNAPSGLNSNKSGKLVEISIPKNKECSSSNVKQKGVWVSEVTTKHSLGKKCKITKSKM
jgi:hypothetical protein